MTAPEFAQLLKAYRARQGFTQAQAAAALGAPLRTWQNWEIGRNLPPSFALQAMLTLLGPHSAPTPPVAKKKQKAAVKKSPSSAPKKGGLSPVKTRAISADSLDTHLL